MDGQYVTLYGGVGVGGWTHVEALRTNDPAVGVLPPQPPEADEVLDDTDGTQQRGADTEHGIRTQLVAREAVPHAKVETNRHAHAVEEDERPEPEDALLARPQAVIERRRVCKVGVIVRDLGMREQCGGVRGGRPRGVSAEVAVGGCGAGGSGGGGAASLVAGAVCDGDAGDLEGGVGRRLDGLVVEFFGGRRGVDHCLFCLRRALGGGRLDGDLDVWLGCARHVV